MAVNCFIQFAEPAIRGESSYDAHPGAVQVLSWSHSFNQPSKPGAGAAEAANHSEFTFSKYLDSATDDLLRHCWSAAPIGSAELTAYRSDGDNVAIRYLTIRMEDVIVSNVSLGGGAGDLPIENISLAYSKLTYIYHQPTGDGAASHDLKAGTVA